MTEKEAIRMFEDRLKLDVIEHVPEYAEAMKMAVSALKENQQHHEIETVKVRRDNDGWIPVDPNNLPDPEVLCCDRYGEQLIGYLSNTEEGFICESNECIMYDVVAWMDKPKPYKKDGE